jgi:hypothetical protein
MICNCVHFERERERERAVIQLVRCKPSTRSRFRSLVEYPACFGRLISGLFRFVFFARISIKFDRIEKRAKMRN